MDGKPEKFRFVVYILNSGLRTEMEQQKSGTMNGASQGTVSSVAEGGNIFIKTNDSYIGDTKQKQILCRN
jgi:lipopolysaccharide export LptBFGC system permease protein LptF